MTTAQQESELLTRVQHLAGPFLQRCAYLSAAPIAFWAALTANESGVYLVHDTNIPPRFEQSIYNRLCEVRSGKSQRFGVITGPRLSALADSDIRKLATSFGFCQVMGYQALAHGATVEALDNPDTHYPLAFKVMAGFIAQYNLDPQKAFYEMADCWNSGSPKGTTFSPTYCSDLLRRMDIWRKLNKPS